MREFRFCVAAGVFHRQSEIPPGGRPGRSSLPNVGAAALVGTCGPAGPRNAQDALSTQAPRFGHNPHIASGGRPGRSSLPKGFTLIELLVVVAIIAILAALVLSTAGYVQKKGATSRAEGEIAALSAALESYKADMGDYPPSTNFPNTGVASNSLYGVLSPSTGKIYFEFNKSMTSAAGITDPFGTAYYYAYPGSASRSGTNFFDLWSTAGTSTNVTNEPRWIKNW